MQDIRTIAAAVTPRIAAGSFATVALVYAVHELFFGYPGQTYPGILLTVALIAWRYGAVTAASTLGATAIGLAYFVLDGEGIAIAKPEQAAGVAILLVVGSVLIWGMRTVRREKDEMGARIADLETQNSMRDGQYAELVHRVRNDLAALAAVVSLYGRSRGDPQAATAALSERIAVLSRLYQRLHMPEKDGARVEMDRFLAEIVEDLRTTHLGFRPISMESDVEEMTLPLRTASVVGLTVNEAVANALKYAFPDERQGAISARLRRVPDNMVLLEVVDDGVGPDGGPPKGSGMGTRLLRAMAAQVGGKYTMGREGDSTVVRVIFPAE